MWNSFPWKNYNYTSSRFNYLNSFACICNRNILRKARGLQSKAFIIWVILKGIKKFKALILKRKFLDEN